MFSYYVNQVHRTLKINHKVRYVRGKTILYFHHRYGGKLRLTNPIPFLLHTLVNTYTVL